MVQVRVKLQVGSGWPAKNTGWVTGQPVFALGQKNGVRVGYFSGQVWKLWPVLPCLHPILHHKKIKLSNWCRNKNEKALKYYALQELIIVFHFLNNVIVLYGVPAFCKGNTDCWRAIKVSHFLNNMIVFNFQLNNHLEIFPSLKLLESFTWAVGSFFFFFLKCLEAAFNALVQACNEQHKIW